MRTAIITVGVSFFCSITGIAADEIRSFSAKVRGEM